MSLRLAVSNAKSLRTNRSGVSRGDNSAIPRQSVETPSARSRRVIRAPSVRASVRTARAGRRSCPRRPTVVLWRGALKETLLVHSERVHYDGIAGLATTASRPREIQSRGGGGDVGEPTRLVPLTQPHVSLAVA